MNKTLQYIGSAIRGFLWRHHFTLFLVLAAGGVTLGIYSLMGVISTTSTAQTVNTTTNEIVFDTATIERVNKLGNSTGEQSFTLPANQRTDPFLEK